MTAKECGLVEVSPILISFEPSEKSGRKKVNSLSSSKGT